MVTHYKVQGSKFCMSMSYHIKQQVVQDIFSKKVSFSWKTEKLDFFVFSEWEKQ